MTGVEGWCAECGRSSGQGATLVRERDTEICVVCKRVVDGTPFLGMTSGRTVGTNHDPAPWAAVRGGARSDRNVKEGLVRIGVEMVYDPRPEFDVPTNSFLAAFRERARDHSAKGAQFWIDTLPHPRYTHHQVEEVEHARRVLTKLVGAWS